MQHFRITNGFEGMIKCKKQLCSTTGLVVRKICHCTGQARAYMESGGFAPSGVQGQRQASKPLVRGQGAKPPEADDILTLGEYIL